MSSGIVVAPGAAIALVALPVIALAAAGAAAVLVIRACGALTEAGGRAAARLGEELARTADKQDQAHVRDKLWQLAATEVVRVNASIRLLNERALRSGVRIPLPAPLTVAGHNIEQIRVWVERTEPALRGLREAVEGAEATAERTRLVDSLPVPARSGTTTADVLAAAQRALRQRHGQAVLATPATDIGQVQRDIDEILVRLDLDATASDRQEALEAAASVTTQTTTPDTNTYLEALGHCVDSVVNPRIERRRLAALWLEGLEDAVVTAAVAATQPLPPYFSSMARLRAVVRDEEDLTDELRRDTRDALAWAEKAAHRQRVLEAVQQCLTEQQFEVQETFSVGHRGSGLRASRPNWHGEHSADFWIDEAGQIRGELLRDGEKRTDEDLRCGELNEQIDLLAGTLRSRGFAIGSAKTDAGHEPQYRYRPGPKVVPAQAAKPGAIARTVED